MMHHIAEKQNWPAHVKVSPTLEHVPKIWYHLLQDVQTLLRIHSNDELMKRKVPVDRI